MILISCTNIYIELLIFQVLLFYIYLVLIVTVIFGSKIQILVKRKLSFIILYYNLQFKNTKNCSLTVKKISILYLNTAIIGTHLYCKNYSEKVITFTNILIL